MYKICSPVNSGYIGNDNIWSLYLCEIGKSLGRCERYSYGFKKGSGVG